MRVVNHRDFPGMHVSNGDTNFFLQFTAQGLLDALTRLQLATRKFPVAFIDLAHRAGGEQKLTIRPDQHPHGHFNHLAPDTAFTGLGYIGDQQFLRHCAVPVCCPAKSRANW